jgi:hypothetical protein
MWCNCRVYYISKHQFCQAKYGKEKHEKCTEARFYLHPYTEYLHVIFLKMFLCDFQGRFYILRFQ